MKKILIRVDNKDWYNYVLCVINVCMVSCQFQVLLWKYYNLSKFVTVTQQAPSKKYEGPFK